jgi:bifunctional polynucleotide phosphatase/kinase
MSVLKQLFRQLHRVSEPIIIHNSCRTIANMASNPLKRAATPGDKSISPPPNKRKLTTTTTNKAVADFFKPASAKEPEKTAFRVLHETLINARYESANTVSRTKPVKIAAFDFDDTLIATKSGLKFARGEDDWRWWHPSVPARLQQLHAEGFAIVVLSNQGAVSVKSDSKVPGGIRSLNNLKGKASAVFKALDLPMSLYAATEKDLFRKPRTGMWEQLLKDYGLGVGEVDLERSVFVGDAAGRAGDPKAGVKKDHSCSDRDFATNIGINFSTPEEFFLGEEVKSFTRVFDPASYLDAEVTSQTDSTPVVFNKTNDLELVLFCGSPGAGKSTFYWSHLQSLGYERVNQDNLKTRDKCIKVAAKFLEDNVSIAVDNTNADIETRAAWLSLGKKLKVPTRLVHFTASAKLCEHNDTVRALAGGLVSPFMR